MEPPEFYYSVKDESLDKIACVGHLFSPAFSNTVISCHWILRENTNNMSRLEKKLSDRLESRDYYEAHQIYRTLFYRMSAQGKWQQLQDLLYNGAIKLLDVNEPTSAIDLAELYVESLQKSNVPVSSAALDRFEQLFTRLPALLEKDTTPDGSRVDRRSEFLSRALQWTMAVGGKKRYREKGHPDFHARVAKIVWREGNYVAARNHFILSDDPEKFASFLIDFQQRCGFKSEKDLFIAQAVLQVFFLLLFHIHFTLLTSFGQRTSNIRHTRG
ncbi:unnamed protein product [Toxocara canis]|uniref:Nuclear pore protein n=1 Tax=Toxocara canis TaxID=6265 RepID=A0A183TZ16_TOXCA|nr:unnamed protein product [Toxocara canis]